MRQCIHTWSNNMYMNVFLCNHVDDWNPVLIKGTSFWGEIPPMISASSKGLTLVVCPVVKFVMVSSSTTKQPEKQRFFSFDTFDTPKKTHTKKHKSFFWSVSFDQKETRDVSLAKYMSKYRRKYFTNFRGLWKAIFPYVSYLQTPED